MTDDTPVWIIMFGLAVFGLALIVGNTPGLFA